CSSASSFGSSMASVPRRDVQSGVRGEPVFAQLAYRATTPDPEPHLVEPQHVDGRFLARIANLDEHVDEVAEFLDELHEHNTECATIASAAHIVVQTTID